MTVIDQLPRLTARCSESGAINGIIETALKQNEKIVAGDAFLPRCAFKVVAKLPLKEKVDSLDLLFFAELLAVTNKGFATKRRAVLPGRLCPAFFDRA